MVNGILGNRDRDLSRLGEDGKLACQNRVGSINTCQQMTLGNPEQIAGLIQRDIDMSRTGIVLDPAICIITENCHRVRSLLQIRIPRVALVKIGLEMFFKFLVFQQQRHQSHHNGGTITLTLVELIVLDGFRVFVVHTGHNRTGATVKHNQMEQIRTCSRLVLCHSTVVDGADCTLTIAGHTITDRMNSLDHSTAQSGLRTAAVLGGELYLLV